MHHVASEKVDPLEKRDSSMHHMTSEKLLFDWETHHCFLEVHMIETDGAAFCLLACLLACVGGVVFSLLVAFAFRRWQFGIQAIVQEGP